MGLRPTQGGEEHTGPATTVYGPLPFPLSSRAKPRDLRFYGPFLGMFSTERNALESSAVTSSNRKGTPYNSLPAANSRMRIRSAAKKSYRVNSRSGHQRRSLKIRFVISPANW
jgi:hypothetical protein